jgi:DNA-binding LacI/PurR family transcriptional regulator
VSESASPAERVRIVDVAQHAGVSRQTVSNVINLRGGFTDETRERVESAIEELGFQPNRYAQSLRSRRTMLLGFDMSGEQLDVTNPFTISFLRAVVQGAAARQYRVVVFAHEGLGAKDFRTSVQSGAVDGFILSDSTPDDPRPRILRESRVPFVVFGRGASDQAYPWVDIDNRAAMIPVVEHLVAAGHRTFGYVSYPFDKYWNLERFDGARDALRAHGLDVADDAVITGEPPTVTKQLQALLNRTDRPTAIMTSSDAMALAVVNVATSNGIRVGVDLAVTGFDAGPLRTMVEPPLTSVSIPVEDIAATLVSHLLLQVGGVHGADEGHLVPTELVLGGSA